MNALRAARVSAGLTQNQLSRKIGYSQQMVSAAEIGVSRGQMSCIAAPLWC